MSLVLFFVCAPFFPFAKNSARFLGSFLKKRKDVRFFLTLSLTCHVQGAFFSVARACTDGKNPAVSGKKRRRALQSSTLSPTL